MKEMYLRFRDWLTYVKNYKENKENDFISDCKLIQRNEQIKKLQDKIQQHEIYSKEKDDLLILREQRIKELSKKYSDLKQGIKELNIVIAQQEFKIEKLEEKIKKKEYSRRKSAGAIGGLKAKINELKAELNQANYTINFYKKHQKSPNIEELKAYEFQYKEVEKRNKQK